MDLLGALYLLSLGGRANAGPPTAIDSNNRNKAIERTK